MYRYLTYLISLIVAMALVSCSETDTPATPEPEPAKAPRTVLVYMVANNSLGSSGYDRMDIDEMVAAARAGHFGNSRLLIYHHGRTGLPVLKEILPSGEQLYLKSYDTSSSSVSKARLLEVILDVQTLASAEHYGLVLWSHGSGWIENGIEAPSVAPQSFGEDAGKHMNVTSLAEALSTAPLRFDYIYFDCCYMASVEVMYQLRNCTDHIVASATELPSPGMPYDKTLRHLMPARADVVAAADATFRYYDTQHGSNRTCTMSVIDTSALDDLAEATRQIYSGAGELNLSVNSIQRYMVSNSCYLYDFGQYVEACAGDADLEAFNNALTRCVIYENATPKLWDYLPINHHSGLSTYIIQGPGTVDNYNYSRLSWYTDVASALVDQ